MRGNSVCVGNVGSLVGIRHPLKKCYPYAKVYKMMYEVDTRSLTLARLYFDDEHIAHI